MEGFKRAHAEAHAGLRLIRLLRKQIEECGLNIDRELELEDEITAIKKRIDTLNIYPQLKWTHPAVVGSSITEDQVIWSKGNTNA